MPRRYKNDMGSTDAECPECCASLILYYDHQGQVRHYCENCEQEISGRDIESERDVAAYGGNDYEDSDLGSGREDIAAHNSDNDISIEYSYHSNRRFF
jgi:hypothetical protein